MMKKLTVQLILVGDAVLMKTQKSQQKNSQASIKKSIINVNHKIQESAKIADSKWTVFYRVQADGMNGVFDNNRKFKGN